MSSQSGTGELVTKKDAIRVEKTPESKSLLNKNFAIKPQKEPQRRIDEEMIDLNKEEAQLDVEQVNLVKQLLTRVLIVEQLIFKL